MISLCAIYSNITMVKITCTHKNIKDQMYGFIIVVDPIG